MMKPVTKATRATVFLAIAGLFAACGGGSDDDDNGDGGDNGGGTPPVVNGGTDPLNGVSVNTLDRMGRPGISTALIASDADKDSYNASGTPATWATTFIPPMIERLDLIDGLDGTTGNAVLGDSNSLATLLVDDRLQLDTTQASCDIYLSLEIGFPGCGGRTLERDVIDDTLRHLVSQNDPQSDLADDDNVFPNAWPFLAPAN